jgi:hypothetical protein
MWERVWESCLGLGLEGGGWKRVKKTWIEGGERKERREIGKSEWRRDMRQRFCGFAYVESCLDVLFCLLVGEIKMVEGR